MLTRRRFPAAVLLAAALLLAAPTLAAPTPDAGPALQFRTLLLDWWGGLTAPVVALFGDPGGEPLSLSGRSTEVLDPDG